MATPAQIETIARHYLAAALWADGEGAEVPPGAEWAPEAIEKARADCAAFVVKCGPLFDAAMRCEGYGAHPDAGSPAAAFGHDYWLTRNGHGVGFWDRPELRAHGIGDALSALCRHSETWLYVGDDGRLYLQ